MKEKRGEGEAGKWRSRVKEKMGDEMAGLWGSLATGKPENKNATE
jgi:hypothetical protein